MGLIKVINNNLNQDLVGENFINPASETIFTLGKFKLDSNFSGRLTKDYGNELSSFVKPITLDDLNIDDNESELIFNFTNDIELNFDRSDIKSYVRFGSTRELLRVSIENIIIKYPASLFISSRLENSQPYTIYSYFYDIYNDITYFKVPSLNIENIFGFVFNNGNMSIPNNNELRNMNISYNKYSIWRKDNKTHYNIIGFTGDSDNIPYIELKVKGNSFPELNNSIDNTFDIEFHVKPQPIYFNKFYDSLNDIEKHIISERKLDDSGFVVYFKEPILMENGEINYTDRRLLWTTIDGYNIDFDGGVYNRFFNALINIGEKYDSIKTDLIARQLSPDSIKTYDLTDEKKITKLLRIYGKQYDEIRVLIDSLVNIRKVTYDKKDNIPDVLVKNLAKTLGWDMFSLIEEKDLAKAFFSNENEYNKNDLTLVSEIDIELWRRILINTAYLFKSKGTRHAIKAILLMIGIPEPFINITEYIYTVDGRINPDDVELDLEDLPSASLPYDNMGYPIAPIETKDFYFQISGTTDGGQAYINLYRDVGFRVNRTVDNKKSWVDAGKVERIHYTTPNYFQEDSNLIINTKEIDATLDISRGIEYDIYCYNKNIDNPITSSGTTKPYIYINIPFDYGNDTNVFSIPNTPLSGSEIQVNFNGITLTKDVDYIRINDQQVQLLTQTAQIKSNGFKDVITLTYLYDKLGTNEYTQVQYIVQSPLITNMGAIVELPEEPKGDIQLVVDGITLTKGTTLFVGDFIINPNNRKEIIIQNNALKQYLQTNPIIRIWYIVDDNTSNAEKRSEVYKINNFNDSKFFFNSSIQRFVYSMDYIAYDIDSIKVTVNGITLQNGKDFTLNPINKRQIYLRNSLSIGYIIGVYYIIGDGLFTPPLLPPDSTFPNIEDMSFLEYLELIQRRLINVKNRKTVTDNQGGFYPTLTKILEEYYRRSLLPDGSLLKSNGYTFKIVYPFINKYNSFFNRFITQLLSATIILRRGGVLIRNSFFTPQKFTYRRGVNFNPLLDYLGDDGAEYIRLVGNTSFNWKDIDFCAQEMPVTTTTTTTTTLPPPTTTMPPATTTIAPTTTIPPTPETLYYGFIEANIEGQGTDATNTNTVFMNNQILRFWYSTSPIFNTNQLSSTPLNFPVSFTIEINFTNLDERLMEYTLFNITNIQGVPLTFNQIYNNPIILNVTAGTESGCFDMRFIPSNPDNYLYEFEFEVRNANQRLHIVPDRSFKPDFFFSGLNRPQTNYGWRGSTTPSGIITSSGALGDFGVQNN